MYGKFNHGIWGYPLVGGKKTCGLEIVDAVFQSSHWDRNTVDEQQENNLPQQFVPLGLGEYSTTFYNLPISTTLHRIGHPTQHPSPNWPSGPDDTSNLWQVGLHTRSQGIHHGTKAIQHHRGVIRSLLLISEKAGEASNRCYVAVLLPKLGFICRLGLGHLNQTIAGNGLFEMLMRWEFGYVEQFSLRCRFVVVATLNNSTCQFHLNK